MGESLSRHPSSQPPGRTRQCSTETGATGPLRRFWRPGMSVRSVAEASTEAAAALVVFGRDNAGKPHASRFEPSEAELAEGGRADGHACAAPDEQRALAAKLP